MKKLKNFKGPKAFGGDRVFVHNYKAKRKTLSGDMVDAGKWEWGKCCHSETHYHQDQETGEITYSHHYRVVLERKSNSGGVLILHVGDDSLETE